MGKLGRMRVAVVVADGFEPAEVDISVAALRDAGVAVDLLAPDEAHHHEVLAERAACARPDRLLADASPEAYDALLVPGGERSANTMRGSSLHLHWVRRMIERGRPVCAIGEGASLLADAEVVYAHVVTSSPVCRADLEDAGARWVDQEVVVDRGIVTSRGPQDLPAFVRAVLTLLEREFQELNAEGVSVAESIDGGTLQFEPPRETLA